MTTIFDRKTCKVQIELKQPCDLDLPGLSPAPFFAAFALAILLYSTTKITVPPITEDVKILGCLLGYVAFTVRGDQIGLGNAVPSKLTQATKRCRIVRKPWHTYLPFADLFRKGSTFKSAVLSK